ncbi:MAG TPA: 50S ribosomal protein L24 [Candidatus Limnocylindrales bacterium]|jgi:large subunit ribosomal protein L24
MAQANGTTPNKVPEIRTGDTVVVLHGKDAGKRGKVERILRSIGSKHKAAGAWRGTTSRPLAIVISGVNIAKRHQKARPHMSQSTQSMAQQGGIVDKPMPIDASNVMIVCPRCDRVTRVKHERLGSGQSVRVCGHCREQLEAGA